MTYLKEDSKWNIPNNIGGIYSGKNLALMVNPMENPKGGSPELWLKKPLIQGCEGPTKLANPLGRKNS